MKGNYVKRFLKFVEYNEVLWLCFKKKRDCYFYYVVSFKIKKCKVWFLNRRNKFFFFIGYEKELYLNIILKYECVNLIYFMMKSV